MNQILLVPEWMSHLHWLVLATIFWGLTAYCWGLVYWFRRVISLAYAVATLCLAMIASCFWLIQIEAGISPVTLFVIERVLWWPLVVALAAAVDLHAAEMNGHEAYLIRFSRWLDCRRNRNLKGDCV